MKNKYESRRQEDINYYFSYVFGSAGYSSLTLRLDWWYSMSFRYILKHISSKGAVNFWLFRHILVHNSFQISGKPPIETGTCS